MNVNIGSDAGLDELESLVNMPESELIDMYDAIVKEQGSTPDFRLDASIYELKHVIRTVVWSRHAFDYLTKKS